MSYVDIVFDGPPSAQAGRFVEVENPQGESVKVGEWIERPDGYWVLRIPQDKTLELPVFTCAHGCVVCARCDLVPDSWRLAL